MTAASKGDVLVLVTSQVVAAKPQMAFKLISALSDYPDWTASLLIAPAKPGGAQLDFRIRVGKIVAPFVLPGRIVSLEPSRLIGWRMGGAGIHLHETFEISAVRAGTKISHTVCCDGRLKGLIGKGLIRTYGGVMRSLDASIARRLTMPKLRR